MFGAPSQEIPVLALAGNSPQIPYRAIDRFCAELTSSWSALSNLSDRTSEAYSSSLGATADPKASLRLIGDRYETETRILLLQPVEQFLRILPIRRSLEAMQECDQDVSAGAVR